MEHHLFTLANSKKKATSFHAESAVVSSPRSGDERRRMKHLKLEYMLSGIGTNFYFIEHAFAQAFITDGITGCNFRSGVIRASCIPNFLAHVIQVIFGFSGAICILMIILAGYEYMLGSLPGGSGGSKEAGIERLRWAIIGFVISSLAFFIIDFFISAIGGS